MIRDESIDEERGGMLHSHGGEDLELRHLTAADGAEGQNVNAIYLALLPKGAQEIQKGQGRSIRVLGNGSKDREKESWDF